MSYKHDISDTLDASPGFTFGCDPELFILNDLGKLVTAAGLIPGTKDKPHVVEYGAVQVDGMAAEFNIDPVTNFMDWDRNIEAVMKQLQDFLPKGYSFHIVPSVRFDKDVFDGAPDEAKELGCNPDFNAWTGEVNPPPELPDDPYLRTASGHIHIGWGEGLENHDIQHILNCRDMVKQLDWYLGAWSVSKDKDPTRRSLYGKAGAYRPKPYGVEYRVLSNFWIAEQDARMAVWNRLQQAVADMRNRFMPDKTLREGNDMLVTMINQSRPNPDLLSLHNFPLETIVTARTDPFMKGRRPWNDPLFTTGNN